MGNCGSAGGTRDTAVAPGSRPAAGGGHKRRTLSSTTASSSTASSTVKKQDIFALVEKGSWNKLRTYLAADRGCRDAVKSAEHRSFVEQNVFHMLCTHCPPEDVLERYLEICGPDLLGCADMTGQLPLHAACAFGASAGAVGVLLEACKGASRTRDGRGMTPLAVLAANSGPNPVLDDAGNAVGAPQGDFNPPDGHVFRALIHANPVALVLTDECGRTPLMLAESAGAQPEVAEGLRKDTLKIKKKLVKRGVLNESFQEKTGFHSSIGGRVSNVSSSIMLPSEVEVPQAKEGDGQDCDNDDAAAGGQVIPKRVSDLSLPELPKIHFEPDAEAERCGEVEVEKDEEKRNGSVATKQGESGYISA